VQVLLEAFIKNPLVFLMCLKVCFHDWYMWETLVTCRCLRHHGNRALVQILDTCSLHIVKGSTIVCLLIMSDFLSFSLGLFILDKQRNDLCVDRQYHLVHHVAKYVRHWECDHNDQANIWKVYPCMYVCQIILLWKQYDIFSLGSLHKPQLLVHLPNTPVMGTWLNIVLCHVMSCHK